MHFMNFVFNCVISNSMSLASTMLEIAPRSRRMIFIVSIIFKIPFQPIRELYNLLKMILNIRKDYEYRSQTEIVIDQCD